MGLVFIVTGQERYQFKRRREMTDHMMSVALETTIRTEVDELAAQSIVVANQMDRERISKAVENARFIKSRVEVFFKDMKGNAFKLWKGICAQEKSYTDKCDAFEKSGNTAILDYDNRVEKERLAEEARLQAIENEKTRKEKERLEAEAEVARVAAQKAKDEADAAMQLAEDGDDNSSVEERERLIQEAKNASDQVAQNLAMATKLESTGAQTVASSVSVSSTVKRQAGESVRITRKARVVNLSLVPREYLMVNEKMLDIAAKTSRGPSTIPGVEFYEERSIIRKSAY
jgi:hypothetical protein